MGGGEVLFDETESLLLVEFHVALKMDCGCEGCFFELPDGVDGSLIYGFVGATGLLRVKHQDLELIVDTWISPSLQPWLEATM